MFLFFSKIVYQFSVSTYHFFIGLFSIFNEKAYRFTKGRLNQDIPKYTEQTIWFHCASLGEFEQAKPLITYCHSNFKYPIIITFFSPSGYMYKNNFPLAKAVYYLPKDSKRNAQEFIQNINPKFAFFIKYEFWFHYLTTLKEDKIPSYLVSGIFRPSQIFFKPYGTLHRKMLASFEHIFVQDQESQELLEKSGITNSSIAYDTRFDTVKQISDLNFDDEVIEEFIDSEKCFIAGSTWLKDEKLIKEAFLNNSNYKLIIAPHDVTPLRIKQIQKLFPNSSCISDPMDVRSKNVLIIDNVGKLSLLYRYARVCYIGGGFGVSVHNVLEAAIYGKPLMYGPNHLKSKEAVNLIKDGAATEIRSAIDIQKQLQFLEQGKNYQISANLAKQYVLDRTGGTEMIVNTISEKVN